MAKTTASSKVPHVTEIAHAIRGRRQLRFIYGGYLRTVEPHILGEDGKGHLALSGFQVGGGSESGARKGWKLFHVDAIQGGLSLLEPFSQPRPDYNPADKSFAKVLVQL